MPTEETTTFEETTAYEATNFVSDKVKVNGFQFSMTRKGLRVISSVESEIYGKEVVGFGNIFGIVMAGYSDDDMRIDNESTYVKQYESTSLGISNFDFTDSPNDINYIMTMVNNGYTSEAYSQRYIIKSYAILSDGSYVYSNIVEYSSYDVVSKLYNDIKMNTYEGHQYLYTDILTVVEPDYVEVDYNWGNTIVK